MATIKKQAAVDQLVRSVKAAHVDDLVEIYNGIFPEKLTTVEKAKANPPVHIDKIIAHIAKGLEVEEILDLWNVIFPTDRDVWFDEDEGLVHYDAKIEHAGLVD